MNSGSIHHGRSFPNCKVVNLRSMASMDPLPQPGSFQLVEVTLRWGMIPWWILGYPSGVILHESDMDWTSPSSRLGPWAPHPEGTNYGCVSRTMVSFTKEFLKFRFESEFDINVLLKLNLIWNSSFAYVSRWLQRLATWVHWPTAKYGKLWWSK